MKKSLRKERRKFLKGLAGTAGAAALPLSVTARLFWGGESVRADLKRMSKGTPVPAVAAPFAPGQVQLDAGIFQQHYALNRAYMASLPVDRLLHTMRVNAGISSPAEPFGGWEAPDSEVRGHMVVGHYLTASAKTYAATGDEDAKKAASQMVSANGLCQKALKNGYLSAFPETFFDRLRDGAPVWAPFYTIHKVMAGHLEVHRLCGNEQALEIAEGMAHWLDGWTYPLTEAHMQRIMNTEFGGIAETLVDLYALTGKGEYLETAARFDHKRILDPLAERRDELKGLHVNTQIPKIVAAARRYETTGDTRSRDIAEYFWQTVTSNRTYANGGTSNFEHWLTEPGHLDGQLSTESCECCCAYNMMRLTRHLFAWNPDPRYFDFYERALFNHRLGTLHPTAGTSMYYFPLASGYWKVYAKPQDSFWCCSGTALEEFSTLNNAIYFHDDNSVYVNLFIASRLDWTEKKLKLRQETKFPEESVTTLRVESAPGSELTFNLRIPYWVQGRGRVSVNGVPLDAFARPSSYLSITRAWKPGDKIELQLPMGLHSAPLPGDESMEAVMYGPLVLAGRFGAVPQDAMYGDQQIHVKGDPASVPAITARRGEPTSWVERVSNSSLEFRATGPTGAISLKPIFQIQTEKYALYWRIKWGANDG